jgi:hypothetical protein
MHPALGDLDAGESLMARLVLPNGFGHGWKKQLTDPRDKLLRKKVKKAPLPDKIYLDPGALSITGDQGEQGSCTGWGLTQALEWSYRAKHGKAVDLSPAFAYLQGRIIEAAVKEDSGCEIRDVVKAAGKVGVCLERYLPYSDSKLAIKASATATRNAQAHQVKLGYYLCKSVDDILQALNAGMPVDGGYSWFSHMSRDSFAETGVMMQPGTGVRADWKLEGGHCNWICGADLPSRMFLLQNSYGDFGAKHPITGAFGYVLMPFGFVEKGYWDDGWALLHE